MKLRALSLFLLCLMINTVFAGTMGDTDLVSAECRFDGCNHPVWEFGAKALYLNVEYGHDPWITKKEVIETLTGHTQTPAILKGYGWGVFADSMYHFASGKALDLNLYYWDYTDKNSGLLNAGLRTVIQRSKWVTGNLELHQVLPIADNNAIRVFMALNYTYLNKKRDFYRDIKNLAFNNINSIHGESTGGFYGAGPRWGAHVHYNLPAFLMTGFSVYGEGAAGILLGRSRSGVVAITEPVTSAGIINRQVHQFSVLFEFDARLGINYSHATRFGLLGAELGWMVFDYLSAIEDKANAESSDVLYEGFFAGVRWQGDLA